MGHSDSYVDLGALPWGSTQSQSPSQYLWHLFRRPSDVGSLHTRCQPLESLASNIFHNIFCSGVNYCDYRIFRPRMPVNVIQETAD